LALVKKSPPPENSLVLSDSPDIGAVGLVEVKLSAKEETELSQPVTVEALRVKPTGQVYAPHTAYTAKFNAAFGRLGWSIVAKAKPIISEGVVICPYMLYIHGKPVAFAYGEQDYFSGNKQQSYGDAVEATVGSALRRCAKRLGLWPELWDKVFNDDFLTRHCIPVKTKKYGIQWRRRLDPPLIGEEGPANRNEAFTDSDARDTRSHAPQQERQSSSRPAPPAGNAPAANRNEGNTRIITEKQLGRLHAIIRNSGRDHHQVTEWIKERFGYTVSKDTSTIQMQDYETICNAIESPEPLQAVTR
jgi:hypothetical protein